VSLLEAASDPYEEIAHVGDLQLPKVGRIIRVRLMPDPEHGPGVDVGEFVLPSYWDRINAARARAATNGRKLRTAGTAEQYVGPMKKGWRLAPFAADELGELLVLAAREAMATEEPDLPV
jgi:hypothetical protein